MDREKLIPDNYSAPPPPYSPNPPPPSQAYGGTVYTQQPREILVEHGRTIPTTRPVVIVAPPDYTYMAIIATLCFFPLGLVALSLARRSRESMLRGDPRTAYTEALSARLISRLAMSVGSLIITAIILAIVLPIYFSS